MQVWKDYQEQHKDRFLHELLDLLRIPSVSAKSEHKADMITCANSVKEHLLKAGATTATTSGSITLTSSSSAGITLGGTQATLGIVGSAAIAQPALATAGAGVSSLDLSTVAGSQNALATLDAAINTINSTRGALGAYQSRFESTVSSLQTTTENLSASRGRIRDADFAKESANLSRAQVLQQAGTAILSQANQSAQGVLSLLR